MRIGDIDDEFIDKIRKEYKKRMNMSVDIDTNAMLVDICNQWIKQGG